MMDTHSATGWPTLVLGRRRGPASPRSGFAARILPLAGLALLLGCSSDEGGGGGDSLEAYQPNHTEALGTLHAGVYFPLVPEAYWRLEGTRKSVTQRTVSDGMGGMRRIDEPPVTEPTVREMDFLEPRSLSLPSGSVTVHPVKTVTLATDTAIELEGFPPRTVDEGISYYERAVEAVNLRASGSEGGEPREADAPTFLKSPLKVGDSWKSASAQRAGNLQDFGGKSDFTYEGTTYVIGKVALQLGGSSLDAVRIDLVGKQTGTATTGFGVDYQVESRYLVSVFLAEGLGVVKVKSIQRSTLVDVSPDGEDRPIFASPGSLSTTNSEMELIRILDAKRSEE